ncbi:hypothetical protein J7T55_004155 [Diaporthe amygdali]|uniref:uncharacterized protein n=1 Tax=Phomopsis amygdali TaxID=1214568 RepID=UPI0022FECA9A|nr:uncharacterized protein J7T55_004155 [Diaporthe amygdali]KAJ0115985.1 hypothetical protein J7T55_004155 [Diaporthe amygdali]
MASDNGPIATALPSITAAAAAAAASPPPPPPSLPQQQQQQQLAPAPPSTASPDPSASEINQSSLKRPRDESPSSPTSPVTGRLAREYSPAKVARLGLSAQVSAPLQLTGVAALEEERRRREEEQRRNPPGVSENPNHRTLNELLSGGNMAISRPQDAPANMEEMALAAEATKALGGPVTIPQPNVSDARTDISPHSSSGPTGTAGAQLVLNSPAPMEIDSRDERQLILPQPEAHMEEKTPTSLSFPGVLQPGSAMGAPAPPDRHYSLPNNGESASTSNKKHKCPYCDTEFTRHHNLKSHLLTHSQEKPYLCQTCNLRFRRLHDLKRHGKLHTGEKPHVCPKCDRKFARGDALARHSKGAGGCAGRRASVGSYGEQGEYDGMSRNEGDDASLALYEGNGDVDMADQEHRRVSLPAMKAQPTASSPEPVGPHSRTYPPVGPRTGPPGVFYPPSGERGGINASSNAPPSSMVNSIAGITESPKPLSPAVHDQNAVTRQHSPGSTSQYQQQPYTRRVSEREIAPGAPLPPPQGPPNHVNSADGSANLFAQGEQGLWAYIQQLEEKVKDQHEWRMTAEATSKDLNLRLARVERHNAELTDELSNLRRTIELSRGRRPSNGGAAPA